MRLTGPINPYLPGIPHFGWISDAQLPGFMESGVLNYLDRPMLIEMRNFMSSLYTDNSAFRKKAAPIDEAIISKPRYRDYFNPLTTPQQNPIRALANVLAELFKAAHYVVPDTTLNSLISEFKALKSLEKD